MIISYLPLLQVQRDLYALPRGMDRFRAYIETMVDRETGDLALPLVAMNPMGRDHVPGLIDQYLALDADSVGARAVADVQSWVETSGGPPASMGGDTSFRATLVVSDDLKGGWTNRYASEFGHLFENWPIIRRGWAVGVLWTADPPSAEAARDAVLTAAYRAIHTREHGQPKTLRDMLAQERWVHARSGGGPAVLDADDRAYTREVIAPHLDATDRATQMACLFGDACARMFGYPPMGLSERAGLDLCREP